MFRRFLVMRIERETAADQAIAQRGRTIAEGAADAPGLKFASAQRVDGQIPVAEDHPADADEIRPVLPDRRLRDVREILLQISVSRADNDAVRTVALEDVRGFDL